MNKEKNMSFWEHLDEFRNRLFIVLGSIVPDELGLTFTIPLTFLALLVNYLRNINHLVVIAISGISSLIFFDAPFKSYIIISSVIALVIAAILIKLKK